MDNKKADEIIRLLKSVDVSLKKLVGEKEEVSRPRASGLVRTREDMERLEMQHRFQGSR